MTGPEWMTVYAASQVGTLALMRAVTAVGRRTSPALFWAIAAIATLLMVPVVAASLGWWAAAGEGIAFLIALALWWWSRRKGRKRAAGLLGGKLRALRDALVRRARQAWQPRPVLVPGGAR